MFFTGGTRKKIIRKEFSLAHRYNTTQHTNNNIISQLHNIFFTSYIICMHLWPLVVLLVHASPGKQKAVYHFLVSHLLSGPILHQPPPRTWNQRYVTLVSGSLLSQEATEEVNLQLFPTGNCKEEVWRGRDATYEFSYTNLTRVVKTADNRCKMHSKCYVRLQWLNHINASIKLSYDIAVKYSRKQESQLVLFERKYLNVTLHDEQYFCATLLISTLLMSFKKDTVIRSMERLERNEQYICTAVQTLCDMIRLHWSSYMSNLSCGLLCRGLILLINTLLYQ